MFTALQGVLLFGFNYWLVYLSEQYISSGLVAIGFSTLIFMNMIFANIFLGDKITRNVFIGAIIGLVGTILIYNRLIGKFEFGNSQYYGIMFLLGSILFASLGNITSAYNQRKLKLPVVQTNGLGMLYGGTAMFIIANLLGKEVNFDFSYSYTLSLLYLSVFGSIIAFTSYLKLVGRIGAGKAAYVIVMVPFIAILLSAIYENYKADFYTFIGLSLLLVGNIIVLSTKR